MKILTYTIDGEHLAIKDKDLYKFLWGKLRPLDSFRKWEEVVVKNCKPWECWTLDGGENPRNAGRFFTIKKCMELTDDMKKKEILWNLT